MRFEDPFDFDFDFIGPFFGGAKRRRRRHGRRRPGWKWFERGDMKFAILALIEGKPMHGYEVMQALEEESAGCYKASAGSIYPTLQLLEDQGYISPQDRDGKKVYSITEEGQAYLDKNRAQVDDIFARVSDFSDRFFSRDMARLSRSFSRLAQATFQGAVGRLDDEALFATMQDILDRAVDEMEAAWDQAAGRRRGKRATGSKRKGDAEESGETSGRPAAEGPGEDKGPGDEA